MTYVLMACTHVYRESQLNRPESVSLTRQLRYKMLENKFRASEVLGIYQIEGNNFYHYLYIRSLNRSGVSMYHIVSPRINFSLLQKQHGKEWDCSFFT